MLHCIVFQSGVVWFDALLCLWTCGHCPQEWQCTLVSCHRNLIGCCCSFHQKMLVQRVCCALVITPECNALSHTLQNTCHFSTRLRLCLEADSEMMWRIWRLVIIQSKRVGPVVVLIITDLTTLAEHISEVIPVLTLCNSVTTQWWILHCCNFPVVTELL